MFNSYQAIAVYRAGPNWRSTFLRIRAPTLSISISFQRSRIRSHSTLEERC
jgi:hypothetical protein